MNPLTSREKGEIKDLANVQFAISRRYGRDPIRSAFWRGRSVGMGKIAQRFNPLSYLCQRCRHWHKKGSKLYNLHKEWAIDWKEKTPRRTKSQVAVDTYFEMRKRGELNPSKVCPECGRTLKLYSRMRQAWYCPKCKIYIKYQKGKMAVLRNPYVKWENPTLTIPIHSKQQLGHIYAAESHLSEAGIYFDRSKGKDERHWNLDWSLRGASIKNPMSARAKLRLDRLYKRNKKDLEELVHRYYRVVDTRGTPKATLISMIMEAEFRKDELGWDNPAIKPPPGYRYFDNRPKVVDAIKLRDWLEQRGYRVRMEKIGRAWHLFVRDSKRNPKIHPQAIESLKRYREDLKAGHTDATEYWRGSAAAYFTANPGKWVNTSTNTIRRYEYRPYGRTLGMVWKSNKGRIWSASYRTENHDWSLGRFFRLGDAKRIVEGRWRKWLINPKKKRFDPIFEDLNDEDEDIVTGAEINPIRDARVRIEDYMYGRFFILEIGHSYSIVLPEKVARRLTHLKEGGRTTYREETGKRFGVVRHGNYLIFSPPRISSSTRARVHVGQFSFNENPILPEIGSAAITGAGLGVGFKVVDWVANRLKKKK